jgi:hypothetical protein
MSTIQTTAICHASWCTSLIHYSPSLFLSERQNCPCAFHEII